MNKLYLVLISLSLWSCTSVAPTPQPDASVTPSPSPTQSIRPSVNPSTQPSVMPSANTSATPTPTPKPTPSTSPTPAFDTDEPCASAAGVTMDQSPWLLPCTEVTTLNIVSDEPGISDQEMRDSILYNILAFDKETQILVAHGKGNRLFSLTEDKNNQTWRAKTLISLNSVGIEKANNSIYVKNGIIFLINIDIGNVYRIDKNKKPELVFSSQQQNIPLNTYSFSVYDSRIYLGDRKNEQIIEVDSFGKASILFKNTTPLLASSSLLDGDLMTSLISNPGQVIKNAQGDVFYNELNCVRQISNTGIKTLTGLCQESTPLNSIGLKSEEKEQTKNARFQRLTDMEINTKGELILLDYDKGKLYKMEPYGHTLLLAGLNSIPCEPRSMLIDEGLARNDDFMADGNGRQSRFFCPTDIALTDDDKVMYIADAGNRAFRKVRIYYSSQARPQREDWVIWGD